MLTVCVGRRELGKTTLALYLTRNVRPRVTFDPRALCPAPNGRATTVDEIRQAFDTLRDDDTGIAKRADLTVTPDHDTQVVFEFVCEEIKAWLQEGKQIAFIVDESTFVDLKHTDAFEWIIRQAPRRAAYLVLTQHRPVDVPIQVRAIVDCWCVFRTIEPRDLDVISERCTESFADKVAKLKPREFLSWDDTKPDNNVGVHLDASLWHVPLAEPSGSGVAGSSRVELPPGNASPEKRLTLFTNEE